MALFKKYIFISFCLTFILLINTCILSQVKILPLGNSITYDQIKDDTRSAGDKIAYRYKLYQLLTNAGYSFDFVGSEKAGGNYLPPGFDDNGGFPGLTNSQLLSKLKTGYLKQYSPDIILLEIGTNGLITNEDAVIYIYQLNSILDEIDVYEKSANKVVPLFLAQIINRAGPNPNGNHLPTSYYNSMMAELKNQRSHDNITLVNMETGAGIDYRYYQNGGDMNDLYHPVQKGYVKMAEKWFTVLDPYFANLRNKAPVIGNIETSDLKFSIRSEPIVITSTITITDLDDSMLSSASVRVNNGYVLSEDVLSFDKTNQINSTWNKETGILYLTGTATVSEYQIALRNVKYNNSNENSRHLATRVISFAVNDGKDNSNSLQRSISLSLDSSLLDQKDIELNKIIIEPNPASDMVKIIFPNPISVAVKIEIVNLQGNVIITDYLLKNRNIYQFSVSDVAAGLYLIRLTAEKGIQFTHKLIISK